MVKKQNQPAIDCQEMKKVQNQQKLCPKRSQMHFRD